MPTFANLTDREKLQVSTAQQRGITHDATIADGAAVTAWMLSYGCYGAVIRVPAGWTAADLTIETSPDGSANDGKIRDISGTALRIVVNATTPKAPYVVTPDVGYAIGTAEYFRLVSTNTASEASANQTGAKALTVSLLI